MVFGHGLDLLFGVFNGCLKKEIFPCHWKVVRFALIGEGKGNSKLASALRRLCMLTRYGRGPEEDGD